MDFVTHDSVPKVSVLAADKSNWTNIYIKLFNKPLHLNTGDLIETKTLSDNTSKRPKYNLEVTIKSNSNPYLNNITKSYSWNSKIPE